jgi:hypothetical protein
VHLEKDRFPGLEPVVVVLRLARAVRLDNAVIADDVKPRLSVRTLEKSDRVNCVLVSTISASPLAPRRGRCQQTGCHWLDHGSIASCSRLYAMVELTRLCQCGAV